MLDQHYTCYTLLYRRWSNIKKQHRIKVCVYTIKDLLIHVSPLFKSAIDESF